MSTPPPVSAEEAAAAIDRIKARRAEVDDPNAWRLSDDVGEVLVYLRRYSQGIPRATAEADVLDGLTLRLRLGWDALEAELWLLERSKRLGIPASLVGQRLGLRNRQGRPDRIRSAERQLAELHGEPSLVRETASDQRKRNAEQRWIEEHRQEFLEIARDVLPFRELASDDADEWLADVARDLREKVVTPGAVGTLRFALAELNDSPRVRQLDPSHALWNLFSRWSQLFQSRPE